MGTHTVAGKFNPRKYVNLVVAIAGVIGSALFALGSTSGHLNSIVVVNMAIAVVGAFQVWYVTETADNPKGKAVIAFVTAGLIAAQSLIATGANLHLAEYEQILVAALTATGLLGTNTTALLRKALPASYANNTYIVDAGTLNAKSEVRPVVPVITAPVVVDAAPPVPAPPVVLLADTVPAPAVQPTDGTVPA